MKKFKTAALIQVDSFAGPHCPQGGGGPPRYGLFVQPHLRGSVEAGGQRKGKNAAIAAADQLLTRYQPSGRFCRHGAPMDDPDNYRYIIDCMLNVAAAVLGRRRITGNDHYREIAAAHTATTLANSFRPDGSTYHTFFMNPDGTPKGGRTCQGYKDDSFWAQRAGMGRVRQRHWLHPTPMMKSFWRCFARRWSFSLPPAGGSGALLGYGLCPGKRRAEGQFLGGHRGLRPAGSCKICGRNRSCPVAHSGPADAGQPCRQTMPSSPAPLGSGQLLHGTYSKKSPYNTCTPEGVDECTSWGDYFYMEALTRLTKDWEMYW